MILPSLVPTSFYITIVKIGIACKLGCLFIVCNEPIYKKQTHNLIRSPDSFLSLASGQLEQLNFIIEA